MDMSFSLIIGGILLLLHVLLVFCLLRRYIPNRLDPMVIHIFSALDIFGLLVVIYLLHVQIQFELVFSILLFGVAGWFFVFGAVYKSLSLRFLLSVLATNGLSTFESLNTSITKKTFMERVILLQKMGLIAQEDESYKLSEKGLCQLRRILMFRKFFGIKTTGLYCQNSTQCNFPCSI